MQILGFFYSHNNTRNDLLSLEIALEIGGLLPFNRHTAF